MARFWLYSAWVVLHQIIAVGIGHEIVESDDNVDDSMSPEDILLNWLSHGVDALVPIFSISMLESFFWNDDDADIDAEFCGFSSQ